MNMPQDMERREEWQALVLGMEDDFFLNVVKTFIGEIETPYNKHSLIRRLEYFFRKPVTAEKIQEALSRKDAEIVTAVILLDEPGLPALHSLFRGRRDLHQHILTLQYRMILFNDTTGNAPRLRINPLLREVLEDAADPELLFPSRSAESPRHVHPWFNDLSAAAFLSFLGDNPDILKSSGELKKKAADSIAEILPALAHDTPAGKRVGLMIRSLVSLGIIRKEENSLAPVWDSFLRMAQLSCSERSTLYWSRAFPAETLGGTETAGLLSAVIGSLRRERLYPRGSVTAVVTALLLLNNRSAAVAEDIVTLLEIMNIIVPAGELFQRAAEPFRPVQQDDPPVLFQASMQVTVGYETPLHTAAMVARGAELEHFDTTSRYELSRKSITRLFHTGISLAEYRETFMELTHPIPGPVMTLLTEWDHSARQITLFDGVVLQADESIRHLIEHDAKINRYIRGIPAPGVYLFDRNEQPFWTRAMTEAGIEQVESLWNNTGRKNTDYNRQLDLPLSPPALQQLPTVGKGAWKPDESAALEEQLMEELKRRNYSPAIEQALAARIKKRLIIFPEQIRQDIVGDPRFQEVKGIDFMGKVKLIEQTIHSGRDLVEVILRSTSGSPERMLISPEKLDRSGNDLLLKGKLQPENSDVTVPVRKLSLVRRLNGVLFFPEDE